MSGRVEWESEGLQDGSLLCGVSDRDTVGAISWDAGDRVWAGRGGAHEVHFPTLPVTCIRLPLGTIKEGAGSLAGQVGGDAGVRD